MALLIVTCVSQVGIAGASAGIRIPEVVSRTAGAMTVSIQPTSPSQLTFGSVLYGTVSNLNTTASTMTATDKLFLTTPSSTRIELGPLATKVHVKAGGSKAITFGVTTSALTAQTGSFSLEVDAVDTAGTIQGTAIAPFTINPLPPSVLPPRFFDLAPSAGIADIHHETKGDCTHQMGTGAGWADYNGDGLLDLFVTDFGGGSHLYRNNGDLTFTDVTALAFPGSVNGGVLSLARASGVTWADYDDDGRQDLLVTAMGHPYLFHHNADNTFTDVTAAAGLAGLSYRGESAAWGDYDRDGFLDLYLVYYNQDCFGTPIQTTLRAPDHLFRNNGDGTFTETTSLLGGSTNPAVTGFGFAATWFDYNNDRWPDLYVVNDYGVTIHPNVLWRNDGGTFTDVSVASKLDFRMSSMGVATADFDRDGNLDLAVSNVLNDVLARNNGDGTFTDEATSMGVARPIFLTSTDIASTSITWGLGFPDLNNDGYEDQVVAGGRLGGNTTVPNAVFLSNLGQHLTGVPGDGSFLDLTPLSGTVGTSGRTLAFGDFDADGWIDVFEQSFHGDVSHLYRNEQAADGNTNSWLEVRLVGAGPGPLGDFAHGSNRDGVGAKLILASGGSSQARAIASGTSLGAGDQLAAHFGLGTATQADSLTILWPSGLTQIFTNLPANQRLVITEGSGMLGNDPVPPRRPSP